mmetsp:Transcript_12868/g.49287  ORF Transcript_12868/g.49287 Transcript_12868/m.49287 type:complete len:313 (+) Transcript_12868:730-1668(+)
MGPRRSQSAGRRRHSGLQEGTTRGKRTRLPSIGPMARSGGSGRLRSAPQQGREVRSGRPRACRRRGTPRRRGSGPRPSGEWDHPGCSAQPWPRSSRAGLARQPLKTPRRPRAAAGAGPGCTTRAGRLRRPPSPCQAGLGRERTRWSRACAAWERQGRAVPTARGASGRGRPCGRREAQARRRASLPGRRPRAPGAGGAGKCLPIRGAAVTALRSTPCRRARSSAGQRRRPDEQAQESLLPRGAPRRGRRRGGRRTRAPPATARRQQQSQGASGRAARPRTLRLRRLPLRWSWRGSERAPRGAAGAPGSLRES